MARRHPTLLRERSDHWRDGKPWDKPFLLVIGVLGPSIVQLVSALDKRFAWSPAPAPIVHVAGGAAFVAGIAITAWAIAVNPFFSAVVRIQTDRDHRVIERGPYAIVRHPGYVGMVLCTLATPVLLGTWWGVVPAVLLVAVVTARTALEDRTLRAELPGYEAYASRVRSRLVPGFW
jgi:protein-S-isoprenylcysteine O-methyltransferase Ste14